MIPMLVLKTALPQEDIEALHEYLAQLSKDTRRLNVLEAALKANKHLNCRKGCFTLKGFTNYEHDAFKTVREAIDAFIKEPA